MVVVSSTVLVWLLSSFHFLAVAIVVNGRHGG
jgi:hypothetical protein